MSVMKKKNEGRRTESSRKRTLLSQTKKSGNTSKGQSSAKKTSCREVGYEDFEAVEEECQEYRRKLFCQIHDHLSLNESSIHAALNKIEALASLEATKPFHTDLNALRAYVGDSNSSRVSIENLVRKIEEMECE